eukprot:4745092-Amphidinium_carterae.1
MVAPMGVNMAVSVPLTKFCRGIETCTRVALAIAVASQHYASRPGLSRVRLQRAGCCTGSC